MSIITTAQAVPSRMFAIYNALFDSENGIKKEKVEAWSTPPSLNGGGGSDDGEPTTTLFSNTLAEARRMGLVEETEDKLRLTEDARNGGKKGHDSEAYFLSYMRLILFDPVRANEAQQSGFMVAMSWFMSCNPLRPMNFSEPPQTILQASIGDQYSKTELTSLNRYQNFLYWARYLGFATIVGGASDSEDIKSRRVFPDPIKAIKSALPTIFIDDVDLPIEQFISRLAAIFPVFETGVARNDFDDMRTMPIPDGETRLSITTSIALQRLVDNQFLEMAQDADAAHRILDFGKRESRVSRVTLRTAT